MSPGPVIRLGMGKKLHLTKQANLIWGFNLITEDIKCPTEHTAMLCPNRKLPGPLHPGQTVTVMTSINTGWELTTTPALF